MSVYLASLPFTWGRPYLGPTGPATDGGGTDYYFPWLHIIDWEELFQTGQNIFICVSKGDLENETHQVKPGDVVASIKHNKNDDLPLVMCIMYIKKQDVYIQSGALYNKRDFWNFLKFAAS